MLKTILDKKFYFSIILLLVIFLLASFVNPINSERDSSEITNAAPSGNWTSYTDTSWTGWGDSASRPYYITTAAELAGMMVSVNASSTGYDNMYFELQNDIDMSAHCWTPIGSQTNPFKGSFNGNGYTITGLNITGSSSNIGLFGYTSGATISKVIVKSSSFSGGGYVGGIVGYADQTGITDCYNFATVSSSSYSAGGIAGYAVYCPISYCYNGGSISATVSAIGGIVGYARSYTVGNTSQPTTITCCYNEGSVHGDYYIGGIAGTLSDSTITKSFNTGSVYTDRSNGGLGGIVGQAVRGTVSDCYNRGSIRTSAGNVGGIAGYSNNGSTIIHCYNTATVNNRTNEQDTVVLLVDLIQEVVALQTALM